MYLKIVILFFCVELYFLQCHCDDHTEEQVDIITSTVWEYWRSKGLSNDYEFWKIDLQGVKDIIELVAGQLNRHYEPFSLEELKEKGSRYRYSLEECNEYVKKLLNCKLLNQAMKGVINELYNEYSCHQQDGISFEDLKALLESIPIGYNVNPPEFKYDDDDARTAVPYKMSTSSFNNFFRDEVCCIVSDFFFPGTRVY